VNDVVRDGRAFGSRLRIGRASTAVSATAAEAAGESPAEGGSGASSSDQSLGIGSLYGTGSLDVKGA